jgi:hypothetical protein
MLGISISPAIAGLLLNVQASFAMASVLFALTFLYLIYGIRTLDQCQKGYASTTSTLTDDGDDERTESKEKSNFRSVIQIVFSPLRFFVDHPWSLPAGLSLFLYNWIQSYMFWATMVHTAVKFGFSSHENGFVLSITLAIGSMYLLAALFAAPYILRLGRSDNREFGIGA